MDIDGYWQENKRFVLSVGAGALVFLTGFMVESSIYQGKIDQANSAINAKNRELKAMQYTAKDLAEVERENEALRDAVARLGEAARFHARPQFVPDPAVGSSANHYLRTLSSVREDLLQRANRAGLSIDGSLGMPELSPTAEHEILRYLEALDLVESVGDLAMRARAARIEKIQTRLDPGHSTRQGVGPIERTRVQMSITGSSLALTRLLAWSQRPAKGGRVLPIDKLEMSSARGKKDQVRLDITFVIARVKETEKETGS